MRVSLERTGGFAGIRMTSTADTDTLPPEDAQKLQQLVDGANFFQLPTTIVSQRPQPDRFQYKLTVEDQDRCHTGLVSEAALPANVRPLTDFLTQVGRRV